LVTDLKNLCEREEPIYVGIAVLCALVAMELLTDSWLVPLVFLAGICITILYNMGTNVFFGQISYITKALAAVLQLAVTMDYSIFLWHSYREHLEKNKDPEKSMVSAIKATLSSVIGSSATTVAGFIALCFMTFTLGLDLGLVMAKGVILGVIGSVTILPALILTFHKVLPKLDHKSILPTYSPFSPSCTIITSRPSLFFTITLSSSFVWEWPPMIISTFSDCAARYSSPGLFSRPA
jgi:predicted RND superfamily exporter protein